MAREPQLVPTDSYPTRSEKVTTVFDRTGPIVHGMAEPGPMGVDTLQFFDQMGYLMIDELLTSEELELFREELYSLSSDPMVKADERTVVEAETEEVRSIFDIHRTNDLFRKIAKGYSSERTKLQE